MSLSVCLLTRNEEKNLGRALGSVAGLADQVVVADTGSTDLTVRLAAQLGAHVCHVPWADDFSAARDFAFGQATGDWILWLNPDEELTASSHAEVRRCMANADAFAYAVRVHEVIRADRPDAVTETLQPRLFRRHPDLHSAGRLHPVFVPPLEELAQREGKQILPSNVVVRRHAYLSALTEPKLRWAARLLELELEDRPGQLHYLIEYGRTLLMLKDPRGHDVLAEAVEQILLARDAPTAPQPDVQRLLEYLLLVTPEASRSRLSHEEARELAMRWFPNSPPLLWQNASHYFQAGDFRQAATLLERLVSLGRTGQYDRSENFDPSIVGVSALMNLGACYTRLGEFEKAEGCFLQLLTNPTHAAQATQNLAVVQNLRRQAAGGKGP